MLYRALLILITGLFITMWTLLIRSEVQPGGNSLRSLPVEHVLRQVFERDKQSQFFIRNGTQRIGSFRLNGHPVADDGSRSLEFFGNAQIELPAIGMERASWSGEIVVTPEWEIRSFRLSTAAREAANTAGPATEFDLLLSPQKGTGSYVVKSGVDVVDQQTFSTDEAGLTSLLDHFQIDPMWRRQFRPSHGPKPSVTARQSTLVVDNIKMETYLLTVVVNGQTLLEVHVSQLGEVLQGTILGWSLDVH